jgi:thiol-disulfide isomerase/thioredoxin
MRVGRAMTAFGAVAGVVLLWAAVRQSRPASGSSSAEEGGERVTVRFFRDPKPVPSFTAVDLDGRTVSTGAGALKGKVVIVNFWATWCPPCRAEIPDLIALQRKYEGTVQVIGVSQDEIPAEQVKRFAAAHGINYPLVMTNAEIERLFPGVHALPTSFVLDREGRLVQKHVGMLNAELTELEARTLAGLPVNVSIEQVDQSQGLSLANGAQALEIPGVELAALSPAKRTEALQKLNGQACTCGCDLTVARCRVDDPTCGISLPLARQIVQKVAQAR